MHETLGHSKDCHCSGSPRLSQICCQAAAFGGGMVPTKDLCRD